MVCAFLPVCILELCQSPAPVTVQPCAQPGGCCACPAYAVLCLLPQLACILIAVLARLALLLCPQAGVHIAQVGLCVALETSQE